MIITEHNYGSLLPSEDEIIAQGRDFAEHEKTCNELAAILFPVINELRNKVKEMEANRIKYANTNIYLINDNVDLMGLCKELADALKAYFEANNAWAKASMTAQVATENYTNSKKEVKGAEKALLTLVNAEAKLKALIAKADRRCQTSGNPF